jgi:aspartate aminotransferase
VIVPTPAWFGFHELVKYSKGKITTLPTTLEEGYSLEPEALRRALNGQSRILLLSNPGNPMGRVYSKTELEALLAVAADYPNLYIISDEIYDYITYDGAFTSILACEGATERAIVVNGFSKTFAMSGWRIGYLVGSKELIAQCTAFQNATMSGISVFSQDAAQAAFENRRQALPPMQTILQENRQLMKQGLDAIPHVRYYLPDGAYYFFPDFSYYLHHKTPQGESITTTPALCKYLREAFNLEMAPGDNFGGPGHARITFALEKSQLLEAMDRLKQGLLSLVPEV